MPPQWTITEGIIAYQYKDGYYFPIIELAEAYDFFVDAETDRAYASGFAGREENTFTIDGERGEYIVKGERKPLPPEAIIPKDMVDDGDIYVRLDILNEIWPIEMVADVASVTINVEAEEELAFMERKRREERWTAYTVGKANEEVIPDLPYHENAYQWLGKPVLDLQSTYVYDNKEKILTGTNSITGTQQVAKFIADFSANYSYNEGQLRRPDSMRLRFGRQAAGEEDLFVPTLKSLEFGDINLGQRDLVANNSGGRGVVISNTPSTRTREFDRITVEGTGPPGWELELYNNNELLELGAIEADGEYRFEDVVLNFGNNRIKVIMYGPQGQIREVVEEHDIGASLLPPKQFRYRAGIADTGRPFVRFETNGAENDERLLTKNAEFEYGVNQWLTVFGSYSRLPISNELEQYYTGGLAASSPLGVGIAEAYRQINGGSALDARFLTELLGVRLNLRSSLFSDNFFSEITGSGEGALRREYEGQANTSLSFFTIPFTLRLNALHREFRDGRVNTDIDTSQTFTGGGVRFGHGTTTRFTDEEHVASNGDFNMSWSPGNWETRASLNYAIYPQFDLTSGTGEIRYKTPEDFQAALTTSHSFLDSTTSIGGQLGYDFKDIMTSLDANYVRERGWQFIVRATTSINPYYPDRSYKLSSESRRNYAPVMGRVFLDRDGDGVFTEGDEALQGARLLVDKSPSREESDENGYVVTSLRADEKAAVRVDEGSLEDPYYRPGVAGYSTVGLVGGMPGFDFPVVETGAIDGTVWRDSSGKPVSGMTLQLVDKDGNIAMTTQTAFDGYYAFEFVLPGTYTVQADPTYQVNVPAETVTVSSEELFAFGIDLYLLEPAAEENAAEEEDGASGGIAQLPTTAPAVSGTEQPAPASPQDEGSSLVSGETSDEDGASIAESSGDQGRSLVTEGDSSGGAPSIVKDVRIGEHPDKVRLVLDLSAPAAYSITEGDEGMVIMIDLHNATWEAKPNETLDYSLTLKGYGTEKLSEGGTRLLLVARDAIKIKEHGLIPAEGGEGPRLYIDVELK